MIETEPIKKRINELLAESDLGQIYMGTISIATSLYGGNSPQVRAVESLQSHVNASVVRGSGISGTATSRLKGILQSIDAEINAGLIKSIRLEAKGEIFADFISMAKAAVNEGHKEVASVLACAALEDSLKRFGEANELNVDEKEMAQVIGALKSAGLVKGAQGKLLSSFTTIRNKAFHAQWDKLDLADVKSVIGFVEQFLLTNF